MSTKANLLKAWSTLAIEDIAEVRHRIRSLSEAGLLPTRKQPLEYIDIARAIIGFTATGQHKDAPDAVHYYSGFPCEAHSWKVDGPHSEQSMRLVNQTLLEALVASLQSPLRVMQFEVNTTTFTCILRVGDGYRTVRTKTGRDALVIGNVITCRFADRVKIPLVMQQVNLSRSIYFPLIDPLLTQLMGHPEPPRYGSIVRADDIAETGAAPKLPLSKRRLK